VSEEVLFPQYNLPTALTEDLRRLNGWWTGGAVAAVPTFRRWPFDRIVRRLLDPIAPILVLRGPRQVGKTTLQHQVIADLLSSGVAPRRIFRVQFDEISTIKLVPPKDAPILRIVDWYERSVLRENLNAAARRGEPAFLFFDEIQNLPDWHVQLKSLVDNATVRVLVTGSSALRIELGRDSLAGRIQTLEIGPLRLSEIAELRGFGQLRTAQVDNSLSDWLEPTFWMELARSGVDQAPLRDAAFAAYSARGGYPVAQSSFSKLWPEIADYLIETVVKRVIQHDLRVGDRGRRRDPRLLEHVFRMACRWAGEAPSLATLVREAELALGEAPGRQKVDHYIHFLASSLLIRAIPPIELRRRGRKGPEKLVLSDPSLRAAWLEELVPLDPARLDQAPELTDLAGRLADSTTGFYFASLSGVDVSWFPEQGTEPEVDYVLTIGDRRIPVEVRYQRRIDGFRDTRGLRSFLERSVNRAQFGLLITRDDGASVMDPRIVCVSLRSLLLLR